MKREFAKPFIMVDGSPKGTVRNIAMFSSYEEANRVTRCIYGDTAFAEEYKWLVQADDIYRDGIFYTTDGEIENLADYIPTDSERIDTIIAENSMYGRVIQMQAMSFTDEMALEIIDVYPMWTDLSNGTILTKTEEAVKGTEITKVRYGDHLYRVLTTHAKQADWPPDVTHSLFVRILIDDPSIITEWEQPNANNAYQHGDKVIHNGKTWESIFDGNNVWEPGVIGTESVWKEVFKY